MSDHGPLHLSPLAVSFRKEKRNGVAFMELTFLKLAGCPAPAERGARTRTGGKRAEARGRWRSKKDRSAGASSVDGGNGSLGIALSISGPLGPSATPLPPYGHYRRLHSIPFHPFSALKPS